MAVEGKSLTVEKNARGWLQRWRVPLGFLTALLFVVFSDPTWQLLVIGVPIALGGAALRAWASGHLRKNVALATSGPYAYTRNPLYWGSFMMAVGCAVSGGSWLLGLLLVGFFLLVYLPVMQAEAIHVRQLFGAEYERYAARVPLFVPRLTPSQLGERRRFDRGQYLRHREYRALGGLVLVVAVLLLKAALV